MTSVAVTLARWAARLEPAPDDLELADRSLRDTVAVTLAARDHRVTRLAAGLPEGARWAAAGHVLDFDDLHMPSTTHVSAVCVPTALATGGGPRAYLAAAGVMARLGTALGWRHYSAGWHATCTDGAPASALSELAGSEHTGLDPARVRRIVLRTPEATVLPLIHHRPDSGLQGKFSLEYAAAVALLDEYPGFGSFTDAAVRRDAARRLVGLVETKLDPGGDWLLDGELEAEIHLGDGTVLRASQQFPPGSPARPPTAAQLQAKLADCVRGLDTDP